MSSGLNRGQTDGLWLVAVVGLVLGGIVTIAGLGMLADGPVILIVGLIFLAFGGGALFTYLSRK